MMIVNWRLGLRKFSIVISLALSGATIPFFERIAQAQITPDGTTNTTVDVNGKNFTIQQGDRVGSNLFHSFGEFSIPTDGSAVFNNAADIVNIFSRVTGGNLSNIDGLLGANGSANLFLLNPAGIMFGENARLDIGGSFFASTASSFKFPDGTEFSATNPEAPPLLTVNVKPPVGLLFEGSGEFITNEGNLAVGSGENLTLLGGTVTSTGSLTAPGGTVQVLGDFVSLLENATIDVSSETSGGQVFIGGNFQGRNSLVNAIRTYIDSSVTINADALTNGNGGRVIVWADEVTGFYGSISARGGSVSGNGGFVEVSGKEHLIFRGNVDTNAVNGFTGTLLLDPTNIIIANGSGDGGEDGTDTFAGNNSGVAGSILSTPLSEIDDTAPTTIFESELEGLSGDTNVILQATNNITLEDLADDELTFAPGSGVIALTADADRNGVGDFVMEDASVVFASATYESIFNIVDDADTIKTNGRNIAISGANLTLGNIDTSFVPLDNAGETIETAQIISSGSGVSLENILGAISEPNDVDIYQIFLTGDGTFSATTVDGTEINTQLFLFDAAGFGVYGNDDGTGCDCFQSTLPAGNALTPTLPGIYYLAITNTLIGSKGLKPVSEEGNIFPDEFTLDFPFLNESVVAPTGAGGALPLIKFDGESSQVGVGGYTIALTGVEGAEATFTEAPQINGDSGSITLTTENGNINIGGRIDSSTFVRGNGGNIFLSAGNNITTGDLESSSDPSEGNAGKGGNITLSADHDITAGNLESDSNSFEGNAGNGGDITLSAGKNITTDRLFSQSDSFKGNAGNGGDITLSAGKNITTGKLFSRSYSIINIKGNAGNGGDITLSAGKNITTGDLESLSYSSDGNAAGNGGDITLSAGNNITAGDLGSYSSSRENVGNGGKITLSAQNGDITSNNMTSSVLASFSVSEKGKARTGGNVFLEAKNKLTNLEILTLSSDKQSGSFKVRGLGDLSIIDTRILTSKQFTIELIYSGEITLDIGETGKSGDVEITSLGDLAFLNSSIESDTKSSDLAGNVNITSPGLITFNNSKIISDSSSTGAAGSISLFAERGITFADSNSGIFAQASAKGKAGEITVKTPELTLQQDAQISTSTTGAGDAGDITLDTPILNLTSGGKVLAFTSGIGDGGTITVNAPKEVNLGIGVQDFEPIISVETSGAGKAGDIFVTTPTLTLSDTARITATATATATNKEEGGSISLNASQMDLAGIVGVFAETQGESPAGTLKLQPDNNKPTLDLTLAPGAKISASTSASGNGGDLLVSAPQAINISGQGKLAVETTGTGDAGNIEITTQKLTLSDGVEISAATAGEGRAGSLQINAPNSVKITGTGSLSVQATNGGTAGNLTLKTGELTLAEGASVTVSSPQGLAGNLNITADSLFFNDGSITAETGKSEAEGANITLEISDLLRLSNESRISAEAFEQANGGNITILNDNGFIIAFPPEGSNGSDIIAKAKFGEGGRIDITTQRIFGIEKREAMEGNRTNDIDASSEFGRAGIVEINTSGIDPTRGLTNLPEETVESEVAEGCQVQVTEPAVAFYDLGRGGLPLRIDEALNVEVLTVPLIPFDVEEEDKTSQPWDKIFSSSEMKGKFSLTPTCRTK